LRCLLRLWCDSIPPIPPHHRHPGEHHLIAHCFKVERVQRLLRRFRPQNQLIEIDHLAPELARELET